MKKIVPFKKELSFKTNIAEVTSISLEHNLHLTDSNLITGSFIITGDYKIADNSTSLEKFSFDLPFDITLDDKYKLDNVILDIDDFYYEILDNKVLSVNIEVLIDKLEEKPLEVEVIEQKEMTLEDANNELEPIERCYDDETEVPFKELDEKIVAVNKETNDENMKSLFDNIDSGTETFSTYKVCIMRENDNIDSIINKYNVTKEDLSLYNDLNDIKIGDKIIVPSIKNAKI